MPARPELRAREGGGAESAPCQLSSYESYNHQILTEGSSSQYLQGQRNSNFKTFPKICGNPRVLGQKKNYFN